MLQRLPSHLNGSMLDHRQAEASYISCVALRPFRCYEHCIFVILYDLCLLPTQFRYVIINIRYLESHVQLVDRCATRGQICTLEINQWCGKPSFASSVITKGGYLSQILKRGNHTMLLT
jgi:hypothetical protein